MKITIIGNLGYIGPVLVSHLKKYLENTELRGIDTGLFQYCFLPHLQNPQYECNEQIFKDARHLSADDLRGSDFVIYLAAVSNDPMGINFSKPTFEINQDAAIRAALLSDEVGAEKFIFASSCSVYGSKGVGAKSEESELNPLTAYAASKTNTEEKLRQLNLSKTKVVCLRFATACGQSPRVRLDLVLNDFVASALTTGKIEVLSDGSPWRPLIDVEDMSNFIRLAMLDKSLPYHIVLNAGYNVANYQIKELAIAVSEMTNTDLSINENSAPDKRSYKVNFSRIERRYDVTQPVKKLEDSINDLMKLYSETNLINKDFRNSNWIRLNHLNYLKERGLITESLKWSRHDTY